jgi:hypothetical protein
MATERTIVWIERLIWTLIYGGAFTAVIGLATRAQDEVLGWSLIVIGVCIAAAGVVLVFVRARLSRPG